LHSPQTSIKETFPSSRTADGCHFIGSLESIRGLAALAVALFHSFHLLPVDGLRVFDCTLWNAPSTSALLMRMIMIPFNGGAAVSLFFVLSGYVLSLSLERDRRPFWPKAGAFTARRFLRIYPALAVNVILLFAVFQGVAALNLGLVLTPPTPEQLWVNLLLIDFPVNGVTWTLPVELAVIPVILLNAFFQRRFGVVVPLLIVILGLVALFTPRLVHYSTTGNFGFLFALGMLAAELAGKGRLLHQRTPAIILLILAISGLLSARFVLGYESKWSLLLEGINSAILILILVHGPRLAIHRILEMPPLRFLGRISYSYYLYHPLTLKITMGLLPGFFTLATMEAQPFLWSAIIALVSVPAAIPFGWAGYVLIEKPASRWGRRL